MKNIAIRTFVVALAVVEFIASSISSAATTQATKVSKVIVPTVVVGNAPAPGCSASSGYCGMR